MRRTRVIPVLLLNGVGLVKTRKFTDAVYVGDPINAVKIFNDKGVDELAILDIAASKKNKRPDFDYLREISSECFVPLCYGGGVRTVDDIREALKIGVEKVAINTTAVDKPDFIREAADLFGSQSIVASVDVKKNVFGQYRVARTANGVALTNKTPLDFAKEVTSLGAGEILLNSIDRDGTRSGYDSNLIEEIANSVSVPVIACGGAGSLEDFRDAVERGASAVAAGSMFVFHGKHRGVLISYPQLDELDRVLP